MVTLTQRMCVPVSGVPISNFSLANIAKETLWVIELHNGDDSRLTHEFISRAFMPALDAVERHWRKNWREAMKTKEKEGGRGALVIVGNRKQQKFFSNGEYHRCWSSICLLISTLSGLDYENASKDPLFFPSKPFVFLHLLSIHLD